MQFSSVTLILACVLAHRNAASPIGEVTISQYVELGHEDVADGGSLVFYGPGSSALAGRSAATLNRYTELSRENAADGGSLVFYGPSSVTQSRRSEGSLVERFLWFGTPKACPASVEPICSEDNGARNEVCDSLVTALMGNSKVAVPESPRQVCYLADKSCCVSWHDVIPGLTKGDLAEHAVKSKQSFHHVNIALADRLSQL